MENLPKVIENLIMKKKYKLLYKDCLDELIKNFKIKEEDDKIFIEKTLRAYAHTHHGYNQFYFTIK